MKRILFLLLAVLALALPASAQRLAGNYLDLAGGYVQTPSAADLNTFPLTVTAWVKTTSNSASAVGVVGKYLDASSNGYSIHIANGRVYAWYFASFTAKVYSGSGSGIDGGVINDGAWHHVAFTVDASGGKMDTSGSPGAKCTSAKHTSATPNMMGRA